MSGREARWSPGENREISIRRICIYRPPGPVSSAFTNQLCQLLDQLVLLNTRFVVVGDFNAPGDIAGHINYHVADVFTQYDLQQHVNVPTHVGGNTLDLVVSQDREPGGQLISSLAVQLVYFSDHHLVSCCIGIPPTPPVTTTYSYRPLRKMDTTAFCHDILQSRLYDSSVTDADEYAELLDAEVKRVLDMHAPLRTGRRRSGQHDNRQLSDEARHAKQLRRRCERRYRRTGLQSDRQAYLSACSAARDSILKSRADCIRSELDEVSGDIGATWRAAKRLLHNDHKVVYDDVESAKLVSTFCQFFIDKVNRIRDNIPEALRPSASRVFAARPHCGLKMSEFQPVTEHEVQVRRLLSTMPAKSSPLDVLPCSLLKTCADVFAPAIATLANLSLRTGIFPTRYKQAQVLPLLKKAHRLQETTGRYRTWGPSQRCLRGSCWHVYTPTCSVPRILASSSRHTGSSTRLNRTG